MSAGDQSAVVEVRAGDEVWAEAAGPRSFKPWAGDVATDDRIRLGSVTKSMTAAVLLQLDGEGAIDLDEQLDAYLPGLLPYDEQPTVRELMQHRGGVPDYLPHLYASVFESGDMTDFYANYRTYYSPEELVEIGVQGPRPTGFAYSNTGYAALGMLIEEVTGNPLGEEMEARIFAPAGLSDTYFADPRGSGVRGPHPVPYLSTGDESRPYVDTSKLSSSQLWAAGAAVSTMHDLNDFYDALADGTLLTPAQLAEATDFQETGKSFDYGLGLFGITIDCDGGPEVFFGHDGDSLGHETQSFHSLDGDRQISLAWNAADRHGYHDGDAFDAATDNLIRTALCADA
ncbi:serine hydrolase domain-containing protein [Glycomyces sp. NPDC047010]|uniref:serine hydrolase domain-containing protein n=1 Tax=Glycomyces sp. NPDC047010 TaxID=3155023 RepID=UPI003400B217